MFTQNHFFSYLVLRLVYGRGFIEIQRQSTKQEWRRKRWENKNKMLRKDLFRCSLCFKRASVYSVTKKKNYPDVSRSFVVDLTWNGVEINNLLDCLPFSDQIPYTCGVGCRKYACRIFESLTQLPRKIEKFSIERRLTTIADF